MCRRGCGGAGSETWNRALCRECRKGAGKCVGDSAAERMRDGRKDIRETVRWGPGNASFSSRKASKLGIPGFVIIK